MQISNMGKKKWNAVGGVFTIFTRNTYLKYRLILRGDFLSNRRIDNVKYETNGRTLERDLQYHES